VLAILVFTIAVVHAPAVASQRRLKPDLFQIFPHARMDEVGARGGGSSIGGRGLNCLC